MGEAGPLSGSDRGRLPGGRHRGRIGPPTGPPVSAPPSRCLPLDPRGGLRASLGSGSGPGARAELRGADRSEDPLTPADPPPRLLSAADAGDPGGDEATGWRRGGLSRRPKPRASGGPPRQTTTPQAREESAVPSLPGSRGEPPSGPTPGWPGAPGRGRVSGGWRRRGGRPRARPTCRPGRPRGGRTEVAAASGRRPARPAGAVRPSMQ